MLAVTSAVGILPSLGSNVGRSDQVGCLNNLRQIGMAFQSWGSDHGDRRPWFVPMTEGGAREHPLKNNAFIHFTFLSNHLSSPAILVDPAENARSKRVATNWSASPQGGFLHPSFANNALSYMLGVHTTIAEADRILVADRHVQSSGVTGCSYGFGPLMLLSFRPFYGWTNGPHGYTGNILINDGHVEAASQERLRNVLTTPDDAGSGDHFLSSF